MDNQHKKIKGYRDLSQEEIDLMNEGKELSVKVGAYIDKLQAKESLDQRWIATGKTDLQKGFMSAIRGIAQPSTF
ncbi:Acb2/Tad1 domain-containing protein [Paraglaciecola sp.]|uniref:Acb2/Tad1 domain-containing protein n=1 Tax=Paraglaciecola sp. TaxID=1920173 RepID=UPI003EF120B9